MKIYGDGANSVNVMKVLWLLPTSCRCPSSSAIEAGVRLRPHA